MGEDPVLDLSLPSRIAECAQGEPEAGCSSSLRVFALPISLNLNEAFTTADLFVEGCATVWFGSSEPEDVPTSSS
jgi:hypothetical protein